MKALRKSLIRTFVRAQVSYFALTDFLWETLSLALSSLWPSVQWSKMNVLSAVASGSLWLVRNTFSPVTGLMRECYLGN